MADPLIIFTIRRRGDSRRPACSPAGFCPTRGFLRSPVLTTRQRAIDRSALGTGTRTTLSLPRMAPTTPSSV